MLEIYLYGDPNEVAIAKDLLKTEFPAVDYALPIPDSDILGRMSYPDKIRIHIKAKRKER